MRSRHLDRLFARFRRRGDARALGKLFDATAPELFRVATHLTKDLHAAEDLVQSTFLAAIEARESWDESQGVLPWLIGILARQAAYERRRRSRTIEPERLEQREASEPAQALEAQELSDELGRAIDGIPTLYREVLIAHLRQGMTPQEIARDLGRAPGTVRVQLHRALEMVRKALPVGLATSAMVAAVSPRGLSAVRGVILRSATKACVSIAASGAVPPAAAAIGGSIMSAKTVLAVTGALLCLAVVGRVALDQLNPKHTNQDLAVLAGTGIDHETVPDRETIPSERLTAPPPADAALQTSATANSRSSVSARPSGSQVSGRLLMPGGLAASGTFVALVRMSDGRPSQAVEEKSTASDGTFALEGDPGSYLVVGLQDQSLPLVRQVALAPSSDLQLEPAEFSSGSRIGGHITILGLPAPPDCEVHAQRQVEGPAIRLLNQDLIWFEGDLHVRSRASRTDDQGRFSLETLEPGLHRVSVEKLPEQRMLRATLDVLAPAADVAIDIEAARLILHLRSEDQPIEGAHIALHENGYGGSVWGFGGKPDLDVLVPPGSAYVVDVDKDAYATAHFDLNMPSSGGTVEQVVELVRRTDSAELVIELVTSNGKQIQGAGFGLFGTKIEPHGRYRPARRSSHGRVPDIVRQVNAEGGVFHLRNLPPDRYTVEVVADGGWDGRSSDWYGDSIEVELGAQSVEQRRMEVRLGGHLRIQCVDRKGDALPARCRLSEAGKVDVPLEFMTHDEKGSTWLGHGSLNTSAPNGANETFPGLPPGRYTLRASLDGYREWSQDVTIESGKVIDVSIVMQDA